MKGFPPTCKLEIELNMYVCITIYIYIELENRLIYVTAISLTP